MEPYDHAMRLALEEARRAGDDVPVGAVVLSDQPAGGVPGDEPAGRIPGDERAGRVPGDEPGGRVLGAGHNERELTGDPTGHAEILAMRRAAARLGSWRLTGCTLVVTLEPCTMCAGAAVLARVDRIIYGAFDPKAGAIGSLWDVVRDRRLNHRPEVIAGVLAEECGAVLAEFFARHRG